MTKEDWLKIVSYDPETGIFRWLIRVRSTLPAGSRAGTVRKDGYRLILHKGEHVYEHRLAWAIMTGEELMEDEFRGKRPGLQLDHINRDRSDNRWVNLRIATRQQNQGNRVVKGYFNHRGRWRVNVRKDGKFLSYASFKTEAEAAVAAQELRRQAFGEFCPNLVEE